MIVLGCISGTNYWKYSPLSRNSGPAERKRPARDGKMLTEGQLMGIGFQMGVGFHIAWINLI